MLFKGIDIFYAIHGSFTRSARFPRHRPDKKILCTTHRPPPAASKQKSDPMRSFQLPPLTELSTCLARSLKPHSSCPSPNVR